MSDLSFDTLETLTGGRPGQHDVACPICGPDRRSAINRKRPVLRIWRNEPGFATYRCARCELSGHVRDGKAATPAPERIAAARAAVDAQDRASRADRLRLARHLWSKRKRAVGSIVETYLRKARGYRGVIPSTIGYLPASGDYAPTMISAFGMTTEPEPGVIAIHPAVAGVHLTQLLDDGSGRTGKIMIGRSLGSPLVVAPMNDLLGLVVCEGIETALSLSDATGCGVWASCGANRMPALADAVPDYTDCVTVAAEPDDGMKFAEELFAKLKARGFHTEFRILTEETRA
jgi:hypothetical protein